MFSFIDNKPVCHKCRGIDPNKSQECKKCNVSFATDERKIFVNTDYYHEQCFLCSDCRNPIGSEKFIRKSDGRQLCQDCFQHSAKVRFNKNERCIQLRENSLKPSQIAWHSHK